MTFAGRSVTLAGIVDIELPEATLRLCDGGYITFAGESYRAKDPEWGTLGEMEPFQEAVGDEAPGGSMQFLPVSAAAAARLAQPANQMAPMRFRLVRVDQETGAADEASAELIADMLLDTVERRFGLRTRTLSLGMIAAADRLFTINEGNVLSSAFHQAVWPGELGLDNAIDVGTTVAWRVKAPPRGSVAGGGGAGGGGGGGLFNVAALS